MISSQKNQVILILFSLQGVFCQFQKQRINCFSIARELHRPNGAAGKCFFCTARGCNFYAKWRVYPFFPEGSCTLSGGKSMGGSAKLYAEGPTPLLKKCSKLYKSCPHIQFSTSDLLLCSKEWKVSFQQPI
jgi:hypothetical protein